MNAALLATRLRVNSLEGPTVDPAAPIRFSWNASSASRDATVLSTEIQLTRAENDEHAWDSPLWSTTVWTSQNPLPAADYDGPHLAPATEYTWRVRLTNSAGDVGEWSVGARFETGFADGSLANAQWIALSDRAVPGETGVVQYLRTDIAVDGDIVRARAYASALGWYRLSVNGVDVTGDSLVPKFTAFEARVQYQSHDITDHIHPGANALGITLADGRFRGRNGGLGERALYGEQIAAIAVIRVDLADGRTVDYVTDGAWTGGHGRIRTSDPKDGEVIDAREEREGWDRVAARPEGFTRVAVIDETRHLVPESSERVIVVDEVSPVSITTTPSGRTLVDFGVNLVGVVRLAATGQRGTEIVLDFGEVLTPAGELDREYLAIEPLMPPLVQRDRFVLAGTGREVFHPSFTIHGFRYVEVSGYPGVLTSADIQAVVMSAALEYPDVFESSDATLNTLHENIIRSMRGNYTDVPTDCPTRERSGWTGDAQVFARAATLLAPVDAYLSDWLTDLAAQQEPSGKVDDIVPRDGTRPGFEFEMGGSAGWGDAAVIIPWTLYERYGDLGILKRQYDSMKAWVEYSLGRAAGGRHPDRIAAGPEKPHERYLLDTGFHWGEWLEPGGGFGDIMGLASQDASSVATAYLSHSSSILARAAALLGHPDDERRFREHAELARDAWCTEFVVDGGMLNPDTQATYARALRFDLLPEEGRPAARRRLAELIEGSGRHVGTGFLSTGFLLDVLSDAGRPDLALDLLTQPSAPSWFAQVNEGATTIWENWDGYKNDGFAEGSHNHYALGAVIAWVYENLVGIRPTSPGWTTARISPLIGDPRIQSARAATRTPHGLIACSWTSDGASVSLAVDIPVGVDATVVFPGAQPESVRESGRVFPVTQESGELGSTARVGSGRWNFSWDAGSLTLPTAREVETAR